MKPPFGFDPKTGRAYTRNMEIENKVNRVERHFDAERHLERKAKNYWPYIALMIRSFTRSYNYFKYKRYNQWK